jgi:predicted DsbA family dithiol-disulfide isomerase
MASEGYEITIDTTFTDLLYGTCYVAEAELDKAQKEAPRQRGVSFVLANYENTIRNKLTIH